MKISLITTEDKRNGHEAVYLNYIKVLDRLGYGVQVIIPENADNFRDLISSDYPKVELHYLSNLDIEIIRRLNVLQPRLQKIIQNSSVVISHDNSLGNALAKTGVPIGRLPHQ